jgi:alpha-1,2-glucosyltransferase
MVISSYAFHTGLNIALFPVLFFFSSLYYTDVFSTLVVLLSYYNHLKRISPGGKSIVNDVWTVLLGIAGLLIRQTNVFWVVFYMGGMETIFALKSLRPEAAEKRTFTSVTELVRFYAYRYSVGEIHDPPLNRAWIDGMLLHVWMVG